MTASNWFLGVGFGTWGCAVLVCAAPPLDAKGWVQATLVALVAKNGGKHVRSRWFQRTRVKGMRLRRRTGAVWTA